MRDLLNMYSDRNGRYGHGDYGSRLLKIRHHPKRMMPQAFQNLQCKYTIFTYAPLLSERLSLLGLR